MRTREPVKVYLRVAEAEEVCIGIARRLTDVPVLLERIAAQLRTGMAPDLMETPPPRERDSGSAPW